MRETLSGMEHGYVNDAIHCSSIDITNPETTPHGDLRGSNEYIRELTNLLPYDDKILA